MQVDVTQLGQLKRFLQNTAALSQSVISLSTMMTTEAYNALHNHAETLVKAGFQEILYTSKWNRYNVIRQRTTSYLKAAALALYAELCVDIVRMSSDESLAVFIRATPGRPTLQDIRAEQVCNWLNHSLHIQILSDILTPSALQMEWRELPFSPQVEAELLQSDHELHLCPRSCLRLVFERHRLRTIEDLVRFRVERQVDMQSMTTIPYFAS